MTDPTPLPALTPMPDNLRRLIVSAIVVLVPALIGLGVWLSGGTVDPTPPDPTTPSTAEPTTGTTGTTAPPTTPTTVTPPTGDFATDRNTGPEVSGLNEDALPSCGHDGAWTISAAGSVQDDCLHRGTINVTGRDVTLRNMVVAGNTTGIIVRNDSGGKLNIERSIVYSTRPASQKPCAATVAYGNYSASESEFYGCADGVKLSGTVDLDRVLIHKTVRFCDSAGCTHNDGLQSNDQAGRLDTIHVTIHRSTITMPPCQSNRIIQAPNIHNSTFDISGNFLSGSHGVINAGKEATETNTGSITRNTLAGTSTVGPFSDDDAHTKTSPGLFTGSGLSKVDRSGNTFEDGSSVPAGGVVKPYRCES